MVVARWSFWLFGCSDCANAGAYRPVEINLSGNIDGSGTVRARQIGNSCSYDFVWQKQIR
jgi:hypothetical protein